jgi:uncharacterized protein YkwD
MVKCDYCNHNIDGLPWRCKYCGRTHCGNHRLPESHDCVGLKEYKERNSEKWKRTFIESSNRDTNEGEWEKPTKTEHQHKKIKVQDKVKYYFHDKIDSFKHWLNRREHHAYDYERRFSYLITTVLILAASIIGFAIFYTNAQKLNSIDIWIIRLAGVLILISLFFAIKYSWRLLNETGNWFKRQKNWLKYIIIVLFIVLLWQAYNHKENVLNPVFDIYNKTNFTLFMPVNLGNISFDSSSYQPNQISTNNKNPSSTSSGGGWFDEVTNRDVGVIEQEILTLVNEERARNGVRALVGKTNLNTYARSWSDKMIAENFFEHSKLNFPYSSIAGENIGETPIHYNVVGCGSTYSNNAMAECFVSGWIGSPGHHKNMISKSFSMTGVGVSCDSSKCRATQVFSG